MKAGRKDLKNSAQMAQDMDSFMWKQEMIRHKRNLSNARPSLRKQDTTNLEGDILFGRKTSNRLFVRQENINKIKLGNEKLKKALVAIDERKRTHYGNL